MDSTVTVNQFLLTFQPLAKGTSKNNDQKYPKQSF
jgi:hypothetical protein